MASIIPATLNKSVDNNKAPYSIILVKRTEISVHTLIRPELTLRAINRWVVYKAAWG